jgi:hypothetical protein
MMNWIGFGSKCGLIETIFQHFIAGVGEIYKKIPV